MSVAGSSRIEGAVVQAVAYADVFDWPLTREEVHRYLPRRASRETVARALGEGSIRRYIDQREGYVTLAGRSDLVAIRRRREAIAARLWPRAIRYGLMLVALPFVRMVAVTGSLALDASDDAADVDLLVVTEDGRVWLARAFAMAVVRMASARRTSICPNYLLAESGLTIEDRSVFTAHELAQMVPLTASAVYDELLRQNAWYREFLPNADPRPPLLSPSRKRLAGAVRRVAEGALRSRLGDLLERWEMERKVRWLSATADSAETRYDATCCKGHTQEHGRRTLSAFETRLRRLEVMD